MLKLELPCDGPLRSPFIEKGAHDMNSVSTSIVIQFLYRPVVTGCVLFASSSGFVAYAVRCRCCRGDKTSRHPLTRGERGIQRARVRARVRNKPLQLFCPQGRARGAGKNWSKDKEVRQIVRQIKRSKDIDAMGRGERMCVGNGESGEREIESESTKCKRNFTRT